MSNTLDIGSKSGYPAGTLSNFTPWAFVIDDIECASMEGFLQALKFDKPHLQVEVCKMTGIKAKNRGKDRNDQWKSKRTLWWNGAAYDRTGEGYQRLLDRAYIAMASQNEAYCKAILDTGDLMLTHQIGRTNERETVLTQAEFCNRLMKMRNVLRKGISISALSRI